MIFLNKNTFISVPWAPLWWRCDWKSEEGETPRPWWSHWLSCRPFRTTTWSPYS